MPKLKPLAQWLCDTCGEVIDGPKAGWLEWIQHGEAKASGFRICHHAPASPRRKKRGDEGCYQYSNAEGRHDNHLDSFVGPDGLSALIAMVDAGSLHDQSGADVPQAGVREWLEIVRRLHTPHYEEARRYFAKAASDGFFDGCNELYPYTQSTLETLIDEYGE
jgi:hypothetical protein